MGWLAVGLVVASMVFIPFLPIASLIVFVCGLAVALFVDVRVEIDDVGVRVRSPISFPRVWIPFDRITAVQAVDVRPMKVGGWGYRGSMRLFRRAAGPGQRFDLRDRRTFVVTVDGAEEAARLISGRHDVEPE
jgi:hypothetical protein